jgi:hypothetical protein
MPAFRQTMIFAATLFAGIPVAFAQQPSVTQSMMAPVAPIPAPLPSPAPLFTIGKLPVGVWAPVEPTYDAGNNRNLAADPVWGYAALPEPPVF